jgi:DNA-binding PadR family transcriptional regulator
MYHSQHERGERHHGHCHGGGKRHAHDSFGRGERGGHRHGPGRRRLFDYGELRLVILSLIAEKPRHGYEIIKAIEERLGGAYSPSPGVVYPTLTLLEELGQVAVAQAEAGRKLHSITDDGRAFLADNDAALRAVMARMVEAAGEQANNPPAAILRAMENVKVALRLRLAEGRMSGEQADAVAAVLDVAAVQIGKV